MATIAVIGAGQMGSGIAQTAAQYGYKVLLNDVDKAIAEKAIGGIGKQVARLVSREKLTADEGEALIARITPIGDYAPMGGWSGGGKITSWGLRHRAACKGRKVNAGESRARPRAENTQSSCPLVAGRLLH